MTSLTLERPQNSPLHRHVTLWYHRSTMAHKGIFCVEGLWNPNLADKSSVRHMLELLQSRERIPYIHRTAATASELEFYLGKWVQARYDPYRILYFACHGEGGELRLGADSYPLDRLASFLEGRCTNCILVFASCSTMDVDRRRLLRFLRTTGALAICGYREDVEWMKSFAFEFLLMSALQDNEFSGRGILAIQRRINREHAALCRSLRFRMVTIKDLNHVST